MNEKEQQWSETKCGSIFGTIKHISKGSASFKTWFILNNQTIEVNRFEKIDQIL